ncbi:MAG: hypothetical protein AAGU74_12805 [Bacillota bacterium]
MKNKKDVEILRDLAKTVYEIGVSDRQNQLRQMWKKHNSLTDTGIPIHVWLTMCPDEIVTNEELLCEDELFRRYEKELRLNIYQEFIKDDTIIEPFLYVRAKHIPDLNHRYGFPLITGSEQDTTKYHFDPFVKSIEDVDKLVMPDHKIDWDATNAESGILRDAVGDVLPVVVDPSPMFVAIEGDISTDIGFLVGFQDLLYYVYDEPEMLHKLAKTLSDGILKTHAQAEQAGDWRSVSGRNQCITYSMELPDPSVSDAPVKKSSLWGFMASQEFTSISPEMFEEFLLPYQIPILEQFGLASYGCCEDLTRKIDMLKRIKNLRRISVTPWANIPSCAETIGRDYVLSWRPNPAEMITSVLEEDAIRKTIDYACKVYRQNGNIADITLKDVKTVYHKPQNMKRWVEIVRSVTEK